ncbi:MAG: family 20 glycosylhydrolase [Firmicutes bacterium]|nr:family 20 glycosylhydrolase [Bacillota bacterium]
MKNMNQTQTRSLRKKVLSLILAVVMVVSLLPISAFASGDSKASTTASGKDYYKILHLDCGRKYFSKDWIIALLNEMSADGYNQLQLAFGNDGLRFLLDDMSFTANGTTYSHKTVVSKVEAGNKLQNNSGDASWLTQTEMDEIIAAAKEKGIEIVPLLNLPGHANAILDIADDTYNASGSNNTLNVASSEKARNFGMAIFKKYVDYFAGKGCKFFNFGADEYANDASGTFSFSRLNSTQYATFVSFINSLAEYIENKGVTARAFNDGLYYNGQSASIDTKIQCCYWSCGWGSSYPVAPAKTIASKGHDMINTNGDYYYVLGKADTFDSDYSSASNFSNAGFMGSTVNSPVGSMFCIWSDYPNAETEQVVAQKVRLPMRAMALRMDGKSINGMGTSVVANGFNADGTLNVGSTGSVTERTITVAVGGTKTVTADGYYNGSYATEDTTIATASAVGTAAVDRTENEVTTIESGKQYLIVHKRSGLVLNDSTSGNGILLGEKANSSDQLWTITKYSSSSSNAYTIQGVAKNYITEIGNGSATLGTSKGYVQMAYNSNGYWNIYDKPYWTNYYLNQYGGASSTMAAGYTADGASDDGSQWQIYQVTPGTKAQTTITFTGKSVGDTSVQIGDVTYKIHVVAEDLSNVTPLTIEYWITNRQVTANGGTNKKINAADSTIYSETGAKFTDLVPATGTQDGNDVVFWKGTRLTSGNKQTDTGGVDKTKAGDSLTYIRYWNTKWSFSADGKTWKDFNSEDQIVAYYLQKTEVTSEITTNVVDWGQPYSEWVAGTDNNWPGDGYNKWFWKGYVENGSKYVFLDFAVVYEDNTQNPSRFPSDNTLFYHFDGCSESNPRILGAISFTENSDYEIWKVTVTDGTSTGYDSYKTFTPTYDNTTETTVWDESMCGIPQIDQLQYTANRSGKLVRVYVRAKVTADSLTVNYYDESNTTLPFYSYNIAVASGTTFNNNFAYSNGSLINNTVTNIKNVTQTVNWKLEEMPEIGAQYRYSDYTFTNANKETGNKVVNLYYKFNTVKTFVVDFGLPLHIDKTDINPALASANITEVAVGKSLYATINANADYSIDYILNKTIDGSDRVTVTYSGTNRETGEDDSATYNLTIIPATSVYYEDSFATFTNANGTKNVAQGDNAAKGIWTKVTDGTTQTSVNQALEALGGTTNTKNVYGYDPAYADSSKFSMGSATKVTVAADTYKEGKTQWPTATFTFTGTGFDVISLTDNTSGAIFVDVYKGTATSGDSVKSYAVNNYYSYKQNENGQWVVSKDGNNALYQIPVMKVSGLDYGEYTAVIRVAYSSFFDQTTKNEYNFWLDAIRVYDPMGKDNATYEQDNEGYPQYIKLHDELVKTGSSIDAKLGATVFIDGAAEATIAQYKNYGPNNEVYLANGQAITFKIPANANIASIQIGAKAPNGTAKMTVTGTDDPKEISSATEMYYKVNVDATAADKVVAIANKGTGILSLTNLKITFKTNPNATVTLAALTDDDQANAVAQVRALFAEPVEPFNPDLFTASWGHSVRKGDTATLTVKTSEDVEAIEVDGQMIDKYVTRTERSGWGWWAKTVTFREFTYTTTADATVTSTIYAFNDAGVSSDAITATLTVRPSVRDWLHGIFGKWF